MEQVLNMWDYQKKRPVFRKYLNESNVFDISKLLFWRLIIFQFHMIKIDVHRPWKPNLREDDTLRTLETKIWWKYSDLRKYSNRRLHKKLVAFFSRL